MSWRPIADEEEPDRLYTVTNGRSRVDESTLDVVTLIVSECDPAPGMQSEHVRILRMCREPVSLVEISSHLGLPVSVVRILLCDLLDTGRITAREPSTIDSQTSLPDPEILKKVLVGLSKL